MKPYNEPGLPLPLGVVIPTINSMAYLPRHVNGLGAWLERAAEVVVVDSHSTDGTVEFLRANLRHPALRFTNHPPGLYASWNHGIAQITAKYVYLATTGDTITRAGIGKLVEAAELLGCDVVISKPNFCDKSGRMLPGIRWPIDDILVSLGVKQPRKLHKLEAIVLAAVHATGAMTGSCASCLFRTETLKRFPFPTDFGTAGDGAWGVQHAAEVRWGVLPERFSVFVRHPSTASAADGKVPAQSSRMDQVLLEAARRWQVEGTVTAAELAEVSWKKLSQGVTRYCELKQRFDRQRHTLFPWQLNPAAWRNRFERNGALAELNQIKRAALAAIATKHCLAERPRP